MILDSAAKLLIKEGYENISIRKIAMDIEYSPATIYLYYKDKKDLIKSVISEKYFTLLEDLEEKVSSYSDDPVERMKFAIRTIIEKSLEYSNLFLTIFCSEIVKETNKVPLLSEGSFSSSIFFPLYNEIKTAQDQNKIKSDLDPELVAQILWTHIYGLINLIALDDKLTDSRKAQLIESQIQMILTGLSV